ncbi:VanZ family protein [Lunatimonas lonarensis]
MYATLTPGKNVPDMPKIPGIDKAIHFILFAGLVFLWSRVWSVPKPTQGKKKKIFLNYLVFGIIFAIFTEMLQCYVPNRSFDYMDIAANIAGGASGMILFVYLNYKRSILV